MEFLRSVTGRVLIEGHRGAEAIAAGNSWEAIKAGYERKADFLELDVQRAEDGSLVLFNSYILPDGRWIRNLGINELQAAKPGGNSLVFLNDALEWMKDKQIFLSLDIKNGFGFDRQVFLDTLRLVEAHNLIERVMFLGWDHAGLLMIKEQNSKVKTRVLLRGNPVALITVVQQARADAISLDADMVTEVMIQHFHDAGIAVVTGMTQMSDISFAVRYGADIVSVRDPGAAREALQKNRSATID